MNNEIKNKKQIEKNKKPSLIDLQIHQFLHELNEKSRKMKNNIKEK